MSTTRTELSHRNLFGHPIGLSVLFGTEMWERFCYYGMRALLTYYMVQFLFLGDEPTRVLGYNTARAALQAVYGPMRPQQMAALIYGLYTFGTYITCLLGGYVADRYLGQRRAVVVGAIVMAAGEFMLMDPALFFVGLLVLVAGNGFFKPNISTQVGGLYQPGDQRIDSAYSIFYVGINLGALLAPILCGRAAHYGNGPAHWNYGFAVAGVGMLIGLAVNLAGQRALPPDVRHRHRAALAAAPSTSPAASGKLTSLDRRAVIALCVVAFFNLFFWGCYEQQGITIALMAANNTHLATPIGTMDPEDIQSFNPFFIFTLTPVLIAFWAWQARRGAEPSPVVKMAIGCALTALCFSLLIIPAMAIDAGHKVTWLWLLVAMALLTVGELYLSPVGLSLFSKAAPAKLASLMMAVNFLSNAAGNYLAGQLGFFWDVMTKVHFFMMIAGITGVAAVAIGLLSLVLAPVLKARMEQ